MGRFSPKPPWLKVRAPGGERYHDLKRTLRELDLYTVCEEARCPNVGECWREGTATVMLLGDVCTRGCRFCAVTTGNPKGAVDSREPEHVSRAIARLELSYVVLTMVNRDDLLDGGAEHVARTVRRMRDLRSDLLIETLVGDFCGRMDDVNTCVDASPDVFAHNIEVVRRITRTIRDVRSSYDQSLAVLRHAGVRGRENEAKGRGARAEGGYRRTLTKSSIMVGLGETDDEVKETLSDLRESGVDVVTIGQYLRPSPKHHEVDRFVHPETFAAYEEAAKSMGFLVASCGPLVRSSYRAAEVYVRSLLSPGSDGEASVAARLEERLASARRGAAKVQGEGAAEAVIPATALVRR